MIVLGNADFAVGMKLAGIRDSYIIKNRDDALEILRKSDKKEFILANFSIIRMVPELSEFKNVVSIPDDAKEFLKSDDLQGIIKSAVGIEVNI
ncbi:MAG: hypothetical protein KKC75_03555 [Nanoarchaeota archaeon]|nr:hypothetical protein [Nanoarchaeota archaeon]MBU1005126.1 hypothetical protein [Nanoarchaeota archaeon]MBU1946972.1 hypothetical protein [Nanoarchaeota archaeon]